MSKTSTSSRNATSNRAAWIGYGDLWPRLCIINAADWTTKQNQEYEEAWRVQKSAMEHALKVETPLAKKMRLGWIGACAPNSSDDVFDKCWSVKEIEKIMEFKKGVIYGLESSRERNEEMLATTKLELKTLSTQHVLLLEKCYADDPEHLDRKQLRVFIRNGHSGNVVKTNDAEAAEIAEVKDTLLGKRQLDQDDTKVHSMTLQAVVPGESSVYWLELNRIRKAVEILSWENDRDEAIV